MESTDIRSCLFLVGILVAFIGWVGVAFVRSPYTPVQSLLYFWSVLLTRIQWRLRVCRPLTLPPNQGAIIVCNHRSSVDPAFLQSSVGRVVHWMVAGEFFGHFPYSWILRVTESIPIRRGAIDTTGVRTAIRYAKSGALVGILPEARLNKTKDLLLPVRSGAAWLALKARIPIVPCYIDGAPYHVHTLSPLWMTARVRIFFGDPIDVTPYCDRADQRGVADDLMLRVLREIAHLAGHDDFQPRLARPQSTGPG